MKLEDVFIDTVKEFASSIRNGELTKGRFIGIYTQRLNSIDKENAFRFKRPQFIGDKDDNKNNWIDYIITTSESEWLEFSKSLT